MSKESISISSILDQLNIKSTRAILMIFGGVILLIMLLFLVISENKRRTDGREIMALAQLKIDLADQKNDLMSDLLSSFNSSMEYYQTGLETDRFQTIYTLQTTKETFQNFLQIAYEVDPDRQFQNEFAQLESSLSDYDLLIASSVNTDGKVPEILENNQAQSDTMQLLMFEPENLTMEVAKARELEGALRSINTQITFIESQLLLMLNQKMRAINSRNPIVLYIVFLAIIGITGVFFYYLMIIRQRSSIGSLSKVLNNIAKGELPDEQVESEKEFRPIMDASNEIVSYLDDANRFAVHVGDGDFDYEFSPKSKNDALGNSLIEMRNRLQQVTREDKIRNWMNEGHAKFGDILRQHNDDLKTLGSKLISHLVDYLNANQGALFILNEDEEDSYLELLSTYAFNRKKFIEKKLEVGEGLAGQAFIEGKTIYLRDIRTDHYNIVTGLGESKPSNLLIVPLKEENKIEGIVEIASLNEIKPHDIEFIESIGESIASSLNAGKVNETTKKLLSETQEKAEEMKAQEEELRQNMEELAATQEQMQRRNQELEEMQQKFDQERYLLNALLNSTNDRIYFKDLESKFLRVSKSMVDLFDKEEESELLGKSDFDFGFGEHAKVAFEDEQRIIRTGSPMEDVVEKEQWDDGRVTWVSTTKNPLKDLEGKIVGTFGISRDVTKSKSDELELHKQKDWLESFFRFETIGFVVLDQHANIGFATQGILDELGVNGKEHLTFQDVFAEPGFDTFLQDIDFQNTRDQKVTLNLRLNNKSKTKRKFMVVAGSKENEDGTFNIFVIQKQ